MNPIDTPLPPRLTLNLNTKWRFIHGEPEHAATPDLDDSLWADIGLPHSFDIPYKGESAFYVGCGWYRRVLDIPADWQDRCLFLDFEGVFQHAVAHVNGHLVGRHNGGYTGFRMDITPFVQVGCPNIIAIRVDNEWDPVLAPRAGEHVFCGGIYRDVHLVVADKAHLDWYGMHVTTPGLAEGKPVVRVACTWKNHAQSVFLGTQRMEVLSPEGAVLATVEQPIRIPAQAEVEEHLETGTLPDVKLWHPDTPTLYRVRVTLLENGRCIDQTQETFGFRWFRVSAQEGFFLNGTHLYLNGANVHQDQAGWGDAVAQSAIRRDVQAVKDCGMNAIRGSHYPHHPAFSRACDELGMLFLSELCFWGIGGFGPDGYWNTSAYPTDPAHWEAFEESCVTTLRDMIRIHRNHASIFAWSMGNEVFFTAASVLDRARNLNSRLIDICREADPDRIAAIGGTQRGGMDRLGDLACYNGDGASLYLDPGFPSLVSEYGSVIAERPGAFAPEYGDCQTERFPWRAGQFTWCAFHHGSIAGQMGRMGMIDYNRLPLQKWFWYRQELRGIAPDPRPAFGKPARLLLEANHPGPVSTDGTEDCLLRIVVADSAGHRTDAACIVHLEVESGPDCFPGGRTYDLCPQDNSLLDGLGAIAVRSAFAGTSIIRASAEGLEEARIAIPFTGDATWDDTTRRPLPPPPSRTYPPSSEGENVARMRPAFVSSEREGHLRNGANDERSDTSWQSAEPGAAAWWMLDMENFYAIGQIGLTTGLSHPSALSLEASVDGQVWIPLGNHPACTGSEWLLELQPASPPCRFIRIHITPGDAREHAALNRVVVIAGNRVDG